MASAAAKPTGHPATFSLLGRATANQNGLGDAYGGFTAEDAISGESKVSPVKVENEDECTTNRFTDATDGVIAAAATVEIEARRHRAVSKSSTESIIRTQR